MAMTRAQPSFPRASACGIPASMPLSVLDHDTAYFYSDACTVYRVPAHDLRHKPGFALIKPAQLVAHFLSKS